MTTNPARPAIALAVAIAVLASTAFPLRAAGQPCVPHVTNGWARLPPVSMPMLAGFGTIRNDCESPATVVGASSSSFGEVSIHETRIEEGVSRMRAVAGLPLEAGGEAVLEPGGLHLMLMQPQAALQPGDTVTVQLQMEDGSVVDAELQVRAAGGA